jgi:hypothetical protein
MAWLLLLSGLIVVVDLLKDIQDLAVQVGVAARRNVNIGILGKIPPILNLDPQDDDPGLDQRIVVVLLPEIGSVTGNVIAKGETVNNVKGKLGNSVIGNAGIGKENGVNGNVVNKNDGIRRDVNGKKNGNVSDENGSEKNGKGGNVNELRSC